MAINNAAQYAINRTLSFTKSDSSNCIGTIGDGYYKFIVIIGNTITEIEILNKLIVSIIRFGESEGESETSFGVIINKVTINDSEYNKLYISDAENGTIVNVEYFDNFTFPATDESSYAFNNNALKYSNGIKYFPDRTITTGSINTNTLTVDSLTASTIELDSIKIGNWTL